MIAADSSTLILLAKAGLLDISLKHLKERLTITPSVYLEATMKETSDALLIRRRVEENKIRVVKVKQKYIYGKLVEDFNIGQGEAETIALCLTHKGIILTDDKKAIVTSKTFNVEFLTAPGILVALYKKKAVGKEEANLMLEKLEKMGRYSNKIIQRVKEDLK